jgi:hypothetical protein
MPDKLKNRGGIFLTMCELCAKAKAIPEYLGFIDRMSVEDRDRAEFTKTMAAEISLLGKSVYSSMNWPVKFVYPMFEARAAFAVPNNYFQNIFLDDERLGNSFSHGAMRSIFFVGERLVLYSKSTNFKDAREFFTSFILLHLEKNEYEAKVLGQQVKISCNVDKPMMNLVTGKTERKKIAFTFLHDQVEGRMVSKEQAASASRFKNVYDKYAGGSQMKAASIDLEGYAVTVPHFSPHPYMLQLKKQFGFDENKEFQLHALDYFKAHLGT